MLIFQNNTFETLCLYAENTYPRECCGILFGLRKNGQRIVYSAVQTENTVGEKQNKVHFLIDPLEVLKAELSAQHQQLEIIGFFHSHPDYEAAPSNEDVLHMIAGYSYPIISVKNRDCVTVKCFEKIQQTDTVPQEEILIEEK